MNKKLQTILVMVLLTCTAFGQTSEEHFNENIKEKFTPQCYFTPFLNLVNSNLNYGNDNSSVRGYKKQSFGLQAGVSIQTVVSSNFSVLSEFYYIKKGGKLQENNPLTSIEIAYRFNSLEIPLLARIHFGRVHVNAGPSIAYNISGSEKTEDHITKMSFNKGINSFRRFEAGIQMGAGYTFPLKNKSLILDIRYNYGLTDISYSNEMFNRNLAINFTLIKSRINNNKKVKIQ